MFTLMLTLSVLSSDAKFPEAKIYNHHYKIDNIYDNFRNFSTYILKIDQVFQEEDHTLDLSVIVFFKGNERKPMALDSKVQFNIVSKSDSWNYLKVNDLALLVDGNRILPKGKRTDGTVGKGYVLEHLWYDVPIVDLLKIADARTVRGKVGTTEFQLTDEQIIAVRDYTARLGLSGDQADKIEAQRQIASRERINKMKHEFDIAVAAARKAVAKLPPKLRAKKGNDAAMKVLLERVKIMKTKYNMSDSEFKELCKDYPELN